MKRLKILLFETGLLIAAIFSSHFLQNHVEFIPSSIIRLPDVSYSFSDLLTTLQYFVVVHIIIFILMSFLFGPWKTSSGKRTVIELFGLASAFALSTLAQFLTSQANFPPNLMVGIAILNAVYFILVFLVSAIIEQKFFSSLTEFLKALIRRIFSIPGFLILLLALTPAILAKGYVSNRDLANRVTQIRMLFSNQEKANFHLVSALGDLRFHQPMLIKNPPNQTQTLYLLERSGKLFRLENMDDRNPALILDLSERVGYIEMENGALGFAFHPKFGATDQGNSYLYVYYTDVHDNRQFNRISRFDLSLDTVEGRTDSELALINLERETSGYHNGGSLEFGSDGYLYIALGEGIRTPEYAKQNETLRMGILRIDVDQRGAPFSRPIQRHPSNGTTQDYFVPLDNPFLDNPELLDEYWALGLRNPFRMSFDPTTHDLWAGDVGSTEWEEVNIVERGNHLQFPFKEGFEASGPAKPEHLIGEEKEPVFAYFHSASERAVIGGVVYRGSTYPELEGEYLFADNYSGNLYQLKRDGDQPEKYLIAQAGEYAQRGISSVVQLSNGDLVVTTLGRAKASTGQVLKLITGEPDDATALNEGSEPTYEVTEDDAAEIFTTNCARCHGADGRGHGPDQPLLKIEIADFTGSEFQSRNDDQIRAIIVDGGAAHGLSPMMPPWGSVLDEAEITALINYIRTTATAESTSPEAGSAESEAKQ